MFFKFCGKSFLPAYFGFRVMKIAQSALILILVVSITIVGVCFLIAPYIAIITCESIDIK
jgi:hypothetical protein